MEPAVLWVVVGGHGKGGVTVSLGPSAQAPKLPERLSTGAIIEQKELKGKCLKYVAISGTGPMRGWVSTEVCELLVKETAIAELSGDKEDLDVAIQLQDKKVQVFNMCSGGVADSEFLELMRAKDKADAKAEWRRQIVEREAMILADQEAEQTRKCVKKALEEAEARRLAAQEEAERQRKLMEEEEERRRATEAAAAEAQLRRSSGDTEVVVYVNRMLKIKAQFWVAQGTTVMAAKESLATVLAKKFHTIQLDLATLRLEDADTGMAFEDADTLHGPRVELVVRRASSDE